MAGKTATDAAVLLKGIISFHLGMVLVGMMEVSGLFVAVEMDIMLFGQPLKFGESWESSQLMRYGEGHGVITVVLVG